MLLVMVNGTALPVAWPLRGERSRSPLPGGPLNMFGPCLLTMVHQTAPAMACPLEHFVEAGHHLHGYRSDLQRRKNCRGCQRIRP